MRSWFFSPRGGGWNDIWGLTFSRFPKPGWTKRTGVSLSNQIIFVFLVQEMRHPQQLIEKGFDQVYGGLCVGKLQCKVDQKIVWLLSFPTILILQFYSKN
jgi:hypothetical protein